MMRKSLKLPILIVLVGILSFSCKKKNSSSTSTSSAASSTSTSTTSSGYYGEFEHRLNRGDSSQYSYYATSAFAWASFYDVATTGSTSINFIDGGNLSVNGTAFTKTISGSWTMYMIYSGTVATSPSQWLSTGSGTVPAINYNDITPWPTYTGKSVLPDTIRTTQNNTILLQGLGGADVVEINLVSGPNWYQKTFPVTTNSVLITPAELASHIPNNSGFMQIIPKKKNVQTISGVPFQFIKTYCWAHNVYFK